MSIAAPVGFGRIVSGAASLNIVMPIAIAVQGTVDTAVDTFLNTTTDLVACTFNVIAKLLWVCVFSRNPLHCRCYGKNWYPFLLIVPDRSLATTQIVVTIDITIQSSAARFSFQKSRARQ